MAIGLGSLIEISLTGVTSGGKWQNVFQYRYAELVTTATPVNIAEAWWNHVKGVYRGLYAAGAGSMFESVFIRELDNPAGEYATFSVPVGERVGTRSTPSPNTFCPPFIASGVRLTVGSRLTRPGQKRLPLIYEADVEGSELQPGWLALVESWADVIDTGMALGAPAATSVLAPVVVSKQTDGTVTADQGVTGHLTNPRPTSQVSRKYGRGT